MEFSKEDHAKLSILRVATQSAKARVAEAQQTEREFVNSLDPELFEYGKNSYSCKPCQTGKHGDCEKRIYAGQGSSWSADCTCYSTTKDFHVGG